MRALILSFFVASLAATANANLVTVDLLNAAANPNFVFSGNVATYTNSSVLIANSDPTRADLEFAVTVTFTGSGDITGGAGGLGVLGGLNDAFIDTNENISVAVSFTPVTAGESIDTFTFEELEHGDVVQAPPFSSIAFADNDNDITNGGNIGLTANLTNISGISGTDLFVGTLTNGGAAPASIAGLTSLSFSATAVPEPTSFALCGLCLFGLGRRRRRRSAA